MGWSQASGMRPVGHQAFQHSSIPAFPTVRWQFRRRLLGPVPVLHALIVSWFNLVHEWGYAGIVLLMAMESSIFPVPSEVVIPPAAYWASQGQMSFWGVVLAGTVGSWIGATATYWAARWLGRVAIARWGRFIACGPDKVERAERLLGRYAIGGIFFARLLPVVRHVVGIPAGILRVPFRIYSAMTLVGSFIWCWVLAWYGQRLGLENPNLLSDPEKFVSAMKHDLLWIVGLCVVLLVLYIIMLRMTAKQEKPK